MKSMLTAILVGAFALATATPAQAIPPDIKILKGEGSEICPTYYVCLYGLPNLNKGNPNATVLATNGGIANLRTLDGPDPNKDWGFSDWTVSVSNRHPDRAVNLYEGFDYGGDFYTCVDAGYMADYSGNDANSQKIYKRISSVRFANTPNCPTS